MIIDKIYNPRDCCHRLYFDLECFPSNAISSVNPASLAMSRAVRPSWREETEGLIEEGDRSRQWIETLADICNN